MLRKPSLLFLVALTAFAFFPPEYVAPPLDRVLLGLLCVTTLWHVLVSRSRIVLREPVVLPLFLLAVISVASAAAAPFDVQTWSLPAAEYVVPLIMFTIARYVFIDESSVERFFIAGNVLLGYLILTSLAWLLGAHWLVFPRFILDPSIGRHFDRARGPFIQAVANGTALSMLGFALLVQLGAPPLACTNCYDLRRHPAAGRHGDPDSKRMARLHLWRRSGHAFFAIARRAPRWRPWLDRRRDRLSDAGRSTVVSSNDRRAGGRHWPSGVPTGSLFVAP